MFFLSTESNTILLMIWPWPEPAKEEIISNFLPYLQRADQSKGPDAQLGNPEINF